VYEFARFVIAVTSDAVLLSVTRTEQFLHSR
jgi:hypothetical protein